MGRTAHATLDKETKAEAIQRLSQETRSWILDHLPSSRDEAISVGGLVNMMSDADRIKFLPPYQRLTANITRLFRLGRVGKVRLQVGTFRNWETGQEIPIKKNYYWKIVQ